MIWAYYTDMGILSALRLVKDDADTLKNQYAPAVMASQYNSWSDSAIGYQTNSIDLVSALQVPTVAKCFQLLTGTIGGIPMNLYNKTTGEELGSPIWLQQPDIRQPRSVTIAYTVQSLAAYGQAFWQVKSQYSDDGRPARFEWVANTRITTKLNARNTEVEFYTLNGEVLPNNGVGSLITFQALNPGVLQTGARTIQAALDLERAAAISAATPMPTSIIKNNGADLPEAQIQGILAGWKAARQSRSTAYLTSSLELQTFGFSPKDMMYDEAKQSLSTEICRLMNVPAYMASSDANKSMTYQNVLDARKEFYAYTLAPYVCAIEDRLSMNDITNAQNVVRFDVNETFLRADTMERLLVIEKLLGLGLISLDQAMAMEDLSPNGDAS
ncbi:MAG: phage portal protein [Caulobacteraceae bacterium]|nr:phage portal protein [Caulobacteraceae bacterium]